jgi:hypothetical protein
MTLLRESDSLVFMPKSSNEGCKLAKELFTVSVGILVVSFLAKFSLSFLLLSFLLLLKPPTLSLFCATHSKFIFSGFFFLLQLHFGEFCLTRENSYLLRNSLRSTHFKLVLGSFFCRCEMKSFSFGIY